jgi:hypothetical protein
LSLQGRERGAHRFAEVPADPDAVPGRPPIGVGTGHVLTTQAVNRPDAVARSPGPARVTPPA